MSEQGEMMQVLLCLRGDISEVRTLCQQTNITMAQHVRDDKLVEGRVFDLEIAQARQKGAARVLALIGTVVGAGFGAIGTFLNVHR